MKTPRLHLIRSLLAVRAVVTAATCDDNPSDGCAAHQAGLALTPIDPVLQLEESLAPFRINVVADRRPAQFDRLAQHLLHGGVEFTQLRARERCGATAWADCRAEERLVSINVPHAA